MRVWQQPVQPITVARESRIPVVIGVGEAITQLQDGADVWVDGNIGVVASFDSHGVWRATIARVVRLMPSVDVFALAVAA